MAAVAPSLAPSLASEYAPSRAWLAQDANPTGKGPVATGPPGAVADPVNGTAPVALNAPQLDGWTGPELAVQAPDYFAESAFPHAGPWPGVPEESHGQGAIRHAGAGRDHPGRVVQGGPEDHGPGPASGAPAGP